MRSGVRCVHGLCQGTHQVPHRAFIECLRRQTTGGSKEPPAGTAAAVRPISAMRPSNQLLRPAKIQPSQLLNEHHQLGFVQPVNPSHSSAPSQEDGEPEVVASHSSSVSPVKGEDYNKLRQNLSQLVATCVAASFTGYIIFPHS